MQDKGFQIAFAVGRGVAIILMGIYYLGVIAPHLLTPNFALDFVVPFAYGFSNEIRWFYMGAHTFYSIVSPANQMLGDKVGRDIGKKMAFISIFAISAVCLAYIDHFPLTGFALGLPFFFFLFTVTAFILPNILKRPKKLINTAFGFSPVTRKLKGEYPFYLKGFYKGKECYINILNGARGLLGMGGAGAGKTASLVEPIIEQGIEMGFTGVIFDFKMMANFLQNPKKWSLSRHVYKCFLKYSKGKAQRKPDGTWAKPQSLEHDRRRVWVINFKDVRFSHRVNPISPRYMKQQSEANEMALSLLQNLNPSWVDPSKREFFANSSIQLLKAIFWFLKKYEGGMFCTIPHAVSISLMKSNQVIAALNTDPDCREILQSINEAAEGSAGQQLAGVVASLQIYMGILNSPELAWTLSDNHFSLDLNDPEDPGILCLGSDPGLQDTYSPVCALIATVIKKRMNYPDRLPSFFMFDEAAQLAIPKVDDVPATGRSNGIHTMLFCQDKSQLEKMYGKVMADSIIANLNNQLYGQLSHLETQKMVSEIIGTREKETESFNTGKSEGESKSKSSGETKGKQRESLIHPYEIGALPKGRFVGKVAEIDEGYDPFFDVQIELNQFHIDHGFFPLLMNPKTNQPITNEELDSLLYRNQKRIKEEANRLIIKEARAACKNNIADKAKVFPQSFYKMGNTTYEIIDDNGLPMVKGIVVDPITGLWTGEPDLSEIMKKPVEKEKAA